MAVIKTCPICNEPHPESLQCPCVAARNDPETYAFAGAAGPYAAGLALAKVVQKHHIGPGSLGFAIIFRSPSWIRSRISLSKLVPSIGQELDSLPFDLELVDKATDVAMLPHDQQPLLWARRDELTRLQFHQEAIRLKRNKPQ